ncbi:LacI family DNA-binding transcriptional regulator [Allostreptomyces psammosilenae]|uniref:LacI family transcriptional regulator n=1 Tax=Allostreptomyces psammosilenae TaxID=1892865 RepID=A0A853A6S6_9ACTN|nr:LacI family DNA-binding transcriptional regulator [Allostreptomyces psammosilenae]NYI06381.1 LacI family transcriptional regulator [Allostreptomyces psammosilenae]
MAARNKPRVTIADIAREAGVSVPTVSKVLNGRAEVAADTRQRVEQLIAKHRYARRPTRQTDRVGLVDLVFSELDSAWAIEIIRSVEEIAQENRIGTVVTAIHNRGANTRQWLDNLAARRSDGVIMAVLELEPQYTERVRSVGAPLILVDPVGQPDATVPSVGAANWSGGLQATEHLISLGHRRIAFIGGPPDVQCTRARHDAYRSALTAAGIPVDPALATNGDFSFDSGEAAGNRLLDLAEPPTAVFAGNDQQALGFYRAARARGLRIPEDISVVGFDDLPVAQWAEPALTTVRQPVAEMAAMATRMLLRYIETGSFDTLRVELATELLVRGSTAPPREATRPEN